VAVVTHIDVIPPLRENGTAIIKQLAEDSRGDAGNLRLPEPLHAHRNVARAKPSAEAHGIAVHTRAFREKLAPASGALYDERYYSVLE